MAIYLGDAGHIELRRRDINNLIDVSLDASDVDVSARRFSVTGIESESVLLSGDRVKFETVVPTSGDQPNLELLAGVTDQTGITRYVHVDPLGGIRLYDTFNEAISGERISGLELVTPSTNQEITIDIEDSDYRCLAQVSEYEITTSRETLDLTSLGEEFRRNYASGLINGQGSCTAIWDYQHSTGSSDSLEYAQYLVQLVLRMQLGSSFDGHFYIKSEGCTPVSEQCLEGNTAAEAIWWEAHCIVSNVAMAFNPGQIVQTRIDFVTTGQFQLKSGVPPSTLVLENIGGRRDNSFVLTDPAPGFGVGLDLND